MKLIIAGTRTITGVEHVITGLDESPWTPDVVSEIVTGDADGVDSAAAELGETADWCSEVSVFPARWSEIGYQAGPQRNSEMAVYGDALLAIWDGESSGTLDMINKARGEDVPVYVHMPPQPQSL